MKIMIAIIVISILCRRASGVILKDPESKIVWVGDRTTLECETDKLPMFWNLARVGTQPIGIYTGIFKENVRALYSAERDGISLIMSRVTARHAGHYECQEDDGFGRKVTVELVVVEFKDTEFKECSSTSVQAYYNSNFINIVTNCTSSTTPTGILCNCKICLDSNKACTNGTYNYTSPVVTSAEPPKTTEEDSSSTLGESVELTEQRAEHPPKINQTTTAVIIAFAVLVVLSLLAVATVLVSRHVNDIKAEKIDNEASKSMIYRSPTSSSPI